MLEVRDVGWSHPDGQRLRAAQTAEIAKVYGRPDSEPAGSGPVADHMVAFVVAYDGEVAVGCGGLRAIEADTGEIKRMYVSPGARGTGAASAVLGALETVARSRGMMRMRLETGDLLVAAQAFYARSGYVSIPCYGPYVGSALSRCFERTLA